jgi:hypothetical protein
MSTPLNLATCGVIAGLSTWWGPLIKIELTCLTLGPASANTYLHLFKLGPNKLPQVQKSHNKWSISQPQVHWWDTHKQSSNIHCWHLWLCIPDKEPTKVVCNIFKTELNPILGWKLGLCRQSMFQGNLSPLTPVLMVLNLVILIFCH